MQPSLRTGRKAAILLRPVALQAAAPYASAAGDAAKVTA